MPRISQLTGSGPHRLPDSKTKKEVTREKFASFLEWLGPDSDSAGEEYERLRNQLISFFSYRHCTLADELADETINRLILKSSEEKIENKLGYCYGVARNVYREWLRKEPTHVDIDEVIIAAKTPEEPTFSSDCLDECLEKLPPETRAHLLDYFCEDKGAKIQLRRRMAEGLKTTQTAFRMFIMRKKKDLKDCVRECMGSPDGPLRKAG
jgi:hypothetical protein